MGTWWQWIDPAAKYVVLGLALLVGTVWSARVWRDLKGEAGEGADDPDDLLAPLAEAYAAGEVSEEEYRKIRASLGQGAGAGPSPGRPPAPRVVADPTAPAPRAEADAGSLSEGTASPPPDDGFEAPRPAGAD